jgi:hypothetical protein
MERSIDPEILDKVSVIWMLASNDADAIITYRGIADRVPDLTVPGAKALVRAWPELFSPIVAAGWLTEWKQWVITDGHYPRWVLALHPDNPAGDAQAIKDARNEAIRNLDRGDVFRSQFRTRDQPARSTTEQIKLGIEHLDRLRKAGMEAREERLRRITGFWLPALALGVTAIATAGSVFVNMESLENSRQIARQSAELTAADAEIRLRDLAARQRGDSFESIMDSIQSSFEAAGRGDETELHEQLSSIRKHLFKLEPLIETSGSRGQLWESFKRLADLCSARLSAGKAITASRLAEMQASFETLRNNTHDRLYHGLFDAGAKALAPSEQLRLGSK